MIRPYPAVSFCLLLLASSAPVFAQSVLDRVVGPTPWNQLLTLTQLNGQNIGGLALAARVPMGLESDQRPLRANWSIPATGRPLREVLDALIAVEPGYVWEEMDGLVLIRPVERATVSLRVLGSAARRACPRSPLRPATKSSRKGAPPSLALRASFGETGSSVSGVSLGGPAFAVSGQGWNRAPVQVHDARCHVPT